MGKFYAALINLNEKKIEIAEEYATKEEADRRVEVGLEPEAMQYQLGMGGRKKGNWIAYSGEEPFSF